MGVRNEAADTETGWMKRARCARVRGAVMFPTDAVGQAVARDVCAGCPVRERCLEYALANRIDHGTWGGCSERERRRLLKERKAS